MSVRRILAGMTGVIALAVPAGTLGHPVVHHGRAVGATMTAAARSDRLARSRCLGVDHVAGAVVLGDRAVEMAMTDGTRWRMTFDSACPALGFYQGFYYRRAVAGRLCAGRDAVISRAGGACPIGAIARVR